MKKKNIDQINKEGVKEKVLKLLRILFVILAIAIVGYGLYLYLIKAGILT